LRGGGVRKGFDEAGIDVDRCEDSNVVSAEKTVSRCSNETKQLADSIWSMKLQSEGESIETYPHKKDPSAKKAERAWMRTVPLSVQGRGVIST
jgi:hypothetical protein